MTTIAVVTKRVGLTLTMQSPSHRFTEVRPAPDWLSRPWKEDVLVLDLETAEVTLDAVETLRQSGVDAPVIVVANESDGWDEVIALHSDLFLVSLPITPAGLMTTVDRAARARKPSPLSVTAALSSAEVQPEDASAPVLAAAQPTGLDVPVPEPRPQIVRPEPTVPTAPAEPAPEPREARPARSTRRDDPIGLVRGLGALVDRLSSVPDAAEVVRLRCASAVRCEASAVLVPDESVWRVSAGEHLRPLEERLQIDQTHWLVSEVVQAGHGVLIRDTDIARTRLTGAPLASWPNLMALPVAEVGAVVLLARGTDAFGRGDLTRGQRAIGSAAEDLQAAMDVRALARALVDFIDDGS